ncbi:hypothetical protein IEN85_07330 [Pelagicoccus sp. NFK12]|uniref:Uncharacterized protein n=1 Tax=Pelagicoccus enzymogenes TaxID=2773457 RepID=A0A927F8Q1_9BACT|nr:hypothetical protein [Pelagicoccus enzymogenes]MBD5779301.1 hypothetical protein [Pelagicoccus enzymogenes]MDQ8198347.1 hypothetical protein [Pelagicoccus enzymogenes]
MSEDDHIDKLMQRWHDRFRPDEDLAARVRARAERPASKGTALEWIGNALSRPGLAAGFAALFVLAGMGLSQFVPLAGKDPGEQLTFSYRLSIDPIYRLQAMTGAEQFASEGIGPGSGKSPVAPVLLAGLGWLQGELDLTEPQYRQVSALHSNYEVAFDELFAELVESHRRFRAFDRKRMKNDVVDYFELYELLQSQKRLSEQSARLTAELLGKVEAVIEPSQKARYRKLLQSLYPDGSLGSEGSTDA